MLTTINKIYIVFSLLCYSITGVFFNIENKVLFALNFFTVIVFALFINYLLNRDESYFTQKKLLFLTFYYTLFFVFCYNLISLFYTGNFYIFSEDDALLYHRESEVMSNMPFIKSIEYYLSRHEAEDLGIVIVLSLLYKVVVSKLMLNLFYIIISILTAKCLFSIASRFMSSKYAFLCAITYCMSSYVIWFHSSGLKESLLVYIILQFYCSYYSLTIDSKGASIWPVVAMPLLILLFRPVLSIFCLVSIALGVVLKRKLTVPQLLFLFAIVFVGIYYLEVILSSTDKFLLGDTQSMLEIKQMEGMVKGSVSFTYLVNTLSSLFGPFPTVLSSKPHLCFFAPGLIFKIFISLTFWFGVFIVYQSKITKAYPLFLFAILEMASLTYILEALELRKSLPQFPLMFVVGFIFIYRFDKHLLKNLKQHLLFNKSYNRIAMALCLLIIYWNFR